MKITVQPRVAARQYSLHDAAITQIKCYESSISLQFEYGYFKTAAEATQVEGSVVFEGVNWDFCYVYILDFCANGGKFSGRKLSLLDFAAQFQAMNFTVLDETYGYNLAHLDGILSVGTQLQECRLEIYHSGNMKYITEE